MSLNRGGPPPTGPFSSACCVCVRQGIFSSSQGNSWRGWWECMETRRGPFPPTSPSTHPMRCWKDNFVKKERKCRCCSLADISLERVSFASTRARAPFGVTRFCKMKTTHWKWLKASVTDRSFARGAFQIYRDLKWLCSFFFRWRWCASSYCYCTTPCPRTSRATSKPLKPPSSSSTSSWNRLTPLIRHSSNNSRYQGTSAIMFGYSLRSVWHKKCQKNTTCRRIHPHCDVLSEYDRETCLYRVRATGIA